MTLARLRAVRVEQFAPWLVGIVVFGTAVWAAQPYPEVIFHDDGVYITLAKSLATGEGYRYLNLPGAPVATHYPPAYPLLLAALWKLAPNFPRNIPILLLANAIVLGLAAWGAMAFARLLGWTRPAAIVEAVVGTLSYPLLGLSVYLLSEPLFAAPVTVAHPRRARRARCRGYARRLGRGCRGRCADPRADAWYRADRRADNRACCTTTLATRRRRRCRRRHSAGAMAVVRCRARRGDRGAVARKICELRDMATRGLAHRHRLRGSDDCRQALRRLADSRSSAAAAANTGLVMATVLALGVARAETQAYQEQSWHRPGQRAARGAGPLILWVESKTRPDAVIAVESEQLVYLFTGRRALPPQAFTAAEYVRPTPLKSTTESLRRVLSEFPVTYIVTGDPQVLRAARVLSDSAAASGLRARLVPIDGPRNGGAFRVERRDSSTINP